MRFALFLLSLGLFILTIHTPARADPPATQPVSIQGRLNDRIDDLTLEGKTIQQVLVAIQEKTRINIVGDWPDLEHAGLDRKKTLHGRLLGVTVSEALQVALAEAGLEQMPGIVIDGHVVTLKGDREVENRAYRLDNLLARMKKEFATTRPANFDDLALQREVVDSLITTIEESIDPDTWRDAGGTIGSLRMLGNTLIITQDPAAFPKIEKLLHRLQDVSAK